MFENKEGQRVPEVRFRARDDTDWVELTSTELFAGKTVIVFALPGAFTPTCSASHVPRYNQLAPEFARHGVDEIVCLSVNDAFVMQRWQEEQEAWEIRFVPDGNGAFTEGMGMLVDRTDLGFGRRSWRYSMLVRDGVIDKMFIEPDVPGDPYEVSDADTMLRFLAPDGAVPADVTVFSRKGCPHCARARRALEQAGIPFEALLLNRDFSERTLRAVSGARTYPQVFVDGRLIGGADELDAWLLGERAA